VALSVVAQTRNVERTTLLGAVADIAVSPAQARKANSGSKRSMRQFDRDETREEPKQERPPTREEPKNTRDNDQGDARSTQKDANQDRGQDAAKDEQGTPRGSRAAKDDASAGPPQSLAEWLGLEKPRGELAIQSSATAAKPSGPQPPLQGLGAPAGDAGPSVSPSAGGWATKAGPAAQVGRAPSPAVPTPPVIRSEQARGQSARLASSVRRLLASPPQLGTYSAWEFLAVNLTGAQLKELLAKRYDVGPPSGVLGVRRIRPPAGAGVLETLPTLLQEMPEAGFALNRIYRPYRAAIGGPDTGRGAASSNRFGGCPLDRCYGPSLIKWQPQLASCARKVSVGVIDTGFDHQHAAFAFSSERIRVGTFVPPGRAKAPNWHGTGVLSLLVGDPRSSTPGLIPYSSLFVADTFFADANGQPIADTASLLDALAWMSAWDVKVVNLSLAGPEDELLHELIKELSRKGTVFVAAAGNDGPTAPKSYPAAYEEVIAVTAVNRDLQPYWSANRGDYIDLAAPGVDVWTAMPGHKEGPQTGTSFATPFVTAVVAAIYGSLPPWKRGADPKLIKAEMLKRMAIKDLGPPGRDAVYGHGLLQAPAGCTPDEPTPPISHWMTDVLPQASAAR
jgi:hypothetical protein